MPREKKTPASWYVIDILIGAAAALYMQYVGSDAGRISMPTYGAGGVIGGVVLIAVSSMTKIRSAIPLGLGMLVFGGLALFLAR